MERFGIHTHWECRGFGGKKCGQCVPRGTTFCGSCGNEPPAHVTQKKEKPPQAGGPNRGKGSGKGEGNKSSGDGAAKDKEIAKLKSQLAKDAENHKKELKRAETAAAAEASAAASPDDMDQDSDEKKRISSRIKAARAQLDTSKGIPEEQRDFFFKHCGGYTAAVAAMDKELADALAENRNSKPLDTRIASAKSHLTRIQESVKRAATKSEELKKQQEELTAKLAEATAAEASMQAELTAAQAQLAQLNAMQLAELAPEAAAAAGQQQLQQAPGGQPNPPPGYVTIEAVNIEWAKREEDWTKQIKELKAAMVASNDVEDFTSEAGSQSDAGSLDDLAEDTQWSKVSRKKRQALLSHIVERKVLAKKVTGLEAASKHSPFKVKK